MATEQQFSIKHVSISRGYSRTEPFTASVSVENQWGDEIKVKLPEDRVLDLIESVNDLIVNSLAQQFNNMREDHVAAIEEQRLKALPPAEEVAPEVDEDVPF